MVEVYQWQMSFEVSKANARSCVTLSLGNAQIRFELSTTAPADVCGLAAVLPTMMIINEPSEAVSKLTSTKCFIL